MNLTEQNPYKRVKITWRTASCNAPADVFISRELSARCRIAHDRANGNILVIITQQNQRCGKLTASFKRPLHIISTIRSTTTKATSLWTLHSSRYPSLLCHHPAKGKTPLYNGPVNSHLLYSTSSRLLTERWPKHWKSRKTPICEWTYRGEILPPMRVLVMNRNRFYRWIRRDAVCRGDDGAEGRGWRWSLEERRKVIWCNVTRSESLISPVGSVPHNSGMSLGVLHNATKDLIYYVGESLLPSSEQMSLCWTNCTVVV